MLSDWLGSLSGATRVVVTGSDGVTRCQWAAGNDALMRAYHDEQWGQPCHDDHELFEMLILEGFQAGLSWSTILNKRENFRRAFDGFDVQRVAAYGDADVARLLADAGIVRNRLKVAAATRNAQAFIRLQDEHGSFDTYLWSFTDGKPLPQPPPASAADVPATTALSDQISKALQKAGMTFVGSTIVYAYLQAVGVVNDHTAGCLRAAKW